MDASIICAKAGSRDKVIKKKICNKHKRLLITRSLLFNKHPFKDFYLTADVIDKRQWKN